MYENGYVDEEQYEDENGDEGEDGIRAVTSIWATLFGSMVNRLTALC